MKVDELLETKEQTKGKDARLNEDLTAKEDFFKSIIDGMNCGVICIDRNGVVVKINSVAKRIFALEEKEDSEGQHISDILESHPQVSTLLIESFGMSTLPNREEIDISMGRRKKKIGFSISLVKSEECQNIGSSIFFRDLTKIEEKEEQTRLKERLAALGQMSASLAHELKNPLGALEVNISFLKRKLDHHREGLEIVDGVIYDINRLKFIINESLSFVRALDLNLSSTDITRVVNNALSSVLTKENSKNVKISKKYEEGLDAFLLDEDLLTRALINIFQNAIDAMDEQGVLQVKIEKITSDHDPASRNKDTSEEPESGGVGGCIRILIKDSGKGIHREVIDKIFYPFFTTKDRGSGLGLSFAKKVVDAHKGFIDVESGLGQGTTFIIQIPIICSAEQRGE
jgi:two-component system sensor histidine kinase HydH